MWLFWPLQSENQWKQDLKSLWSHLQLPEHKSSAPGTDCRLFYNGIYADAAKILCYQEPTSYDVGWQWFAVTDAVSQRRTRATRDDQGMGCEATKGTQSRKGNEMAVCTLAAPHQNGCTESLMKSTKIALKRGIGEQILTPFKLYTCLLEETLSVLLYNCEYSWVVDSLSSPAKQ